MEDIEGQESEEGLPPEQYALSARFTFLKTLFLNLGGFLKWSSSRATTFAECQAMSSAHQSETWRHNLQV